MRICLYTESALPMLGGQELVVDALARQYAALGHEPLVLAPPPRSPLVAADEQLPYPVVRHPRFVSTRRLVEWYQWWLLRAHRRHRFDVLHCHSVHPTGYLGVLARRRHGAPVVITSHGGDVALSNHRLNKPGARERHAQALAEADALVAISRFTREGYLRLLPSAGPIHDIPNGVHVSTFAAGVPRPAELPADIASGGYLLFLGRLSQRKGVDVLLSAMKALGRKDLKLVIAGRGEERAALESQASGLKPQVSFLGPVGGNTKTYLLQNALATVIPSRDWEAFPLVVLESFAAGRPVIASRIPGLEDLIEPGKTGWLVPPDSPGELATALSAAADDPATREAMGRRASAHAARFDWATVAGEYLTLFGELLARRAAA